MKSAVFEASFEEVFKGTGVTKFSSHEFRIAVMFIDGTNNGWTICGKLMENGNYKVSFLKPEAESLFRDKKIAHIIPVGGLSGNFNYVREIFTPVQIILNRLNQPI